MLSKLKKLINSLRLILIKNVYVGRYIYECSNICLLTTLLSRSNTVIFYYTFGDLELNRWLFGETVQPRNTNKNVKIYKFNETYVFIFDIYNVQNVVSQLIPEIEDYEIPFELPNNLSNVLQISSHRVYELKPTILNSYMYTKYDIDRKNNSYTIKNLHIVPDYYIINDPPVCTRIKNNPTVITELVVTCDINNKICSVKVNDDHPNCNTDHYYCLGSLKGLNFGLESLELIITNMKTYNLNNCYFYPKFIKFE